jgi:secondary thiamine-phosphate synthase enzyme
MSEGGAVVACNALRKTYEGGPQPVPVLMGVDLEIFRAQRVAIMGRSGSGKSTLLHLLGGLDTPTSGQVFIEGRAFSEMSELERARTRNASICFIYQVHHLLAEFTSVENVAMPLFIRRMGRVQALVKKSNAQNGMVVVYCPHTTAAITINENADPDVQHDLLTKLGELVPKREKFYQHGEGNSDSHLKTSMVGNSATVLLEGGDLNELADRHADEWEALALTELSATARPTV